MHKGAEEGGYLGSNVLFRGYLWYQVPPGGAGLGMPRGLGTHSRVGMLGARSPARGGYVQRGRYMGHGILRDTVEKRTVRIILEYFLVIEVFNTNLYLYPKKIGIGNKKKFNVNLDPSMTFTFISHMYRTE